MVANGERLQRRGSQRADKTLATVGRPGIAADMAKTRDVAQRSAALFAGCTALSSRVGRFRFVPATIGIGGVDSETALGPMM